MPGIVAGQSELLEVSGGPLWPGGGGDRLGVRGTYRRVVSSGAVKSGVVAGAASTSASSSSEAEKEKEKGA